MSDRSSSSRSREGLVFVKSFDKDNCQSKKELERLLKYVIPSQRRLIKSELFLVNIGLQGEAQVVFELKNIYNLPGFVFHDICLKYKDNEAQFDFIIITRWFICVIETKKLYGNIEIDAEGNFIRTFYNKNLKTKKEGVYSPVEQNKKHCLILENLLRTNESLKMLPIYSIVCYSNDKIIINKKAAPKYIQDIVIKTEQIGNKLKYFYEKNKYNGVYYNDIKNIVSFIENNAINHEVDYVKKLNLEFLKRKDTNEFSNNSKIEKKLKGFRYIKSKQLNVSKDAILTDEEVDKILQSIPKSINDLYSIIDKNKAHSFGEDILQIIRKNKN